MSNQQTPIQFTGKAGEYFGIWIVNLLLTIVTLGIYSAWAKVRRKKYFYHNTLIDGVGFDYHAKPIAILKGRVIAVVFFILYQVAAKFSPIMSMLLGLVFLVALPWIMVRGLTFNARNTSHRGLRFDFDGSLKEAIKIFVGYPLLVFITLGLAYPFVAQRVRKYVVGHHKFGGSHFEMDAPVKKFYMVYLKSLGAIAALGIIAAIVIPHFADKKPTQTSSNDVLNMHSFSSNTYGTEFIETAVAAQVSTQDEATQNLNPEERAEYEAQMKALEEQIKKAGADSKAKDALGGVLGEESSKKTSLIILGATLVILIEVILYLFIYAYIHSRISNLIWNNTKLDHLAFISNQRARDLLWLYLSNAVVLIFTIGLATPWAQVRMMRYRASHLIVTGETNWDKFVGEKKEASRALGEEIADMFDVDLSFG